MKASFSFFILLACLVMQRSVAQKTTDEISKPVKALFQTVRTSKDDQAFRYFATEEQGRYLLGGYWDQGTNTQRTTFTQLFQSIFKKVAFPSIRENLKTLSSVIYEPPAIRGNEATVKSIIVLDNPLKKQEMKLQYSLVKIKGAWKVVDVAVLGSSMLAGIRDDMLQPLLKEGGWNAVLDAMLKKDAE